MLQSPALLVCSPNRQILRWIVVERLAAQGTAQRDHSRASFDVSKPASFIDQLSADDTEMIPIFNVSVF
jgi:hypothetical protein